MPDPTPNAPTEPTAIDEAELESLAAGLGHLAGEDAIRLSRILAECRRARLAEATLYAGQLDASSHQATLAEDIAQIALDTAEWLKTLWNVGYMGSGRFPAEPRSEFPRVEVEDVIGSALLSRIRQGKRPLPFPPPTRNGIPWHEVVEAPGPFPVNATLIRDDDGIPVGAAIESCLDWQVMAPAADADLRVQHRGKGPIYRLVPGGEADTAVLHREAPAWSRRILGQSRAGLTRFRLEWPGDDGRTRSIALRAGSWERAEAEASYWIAENHPEMYGQVRFERHDG